jgi:hypothetical protein
MTRSESIAALAKALAAAQRELEGASKDATNPHFKSKYADLAAVWESCQKVLPKNGIAVIQPVSVVNGEVVVTTMLVHESGEFISCELPLVPSQSTPQAVGSAITYGRRYGLSAMVGVAPEDDDGNAASAGDKTPFVRPNPTPLVTPRAGAPQVRPSVNQAVAPRPAMSSARPNGAVTTRIPDDVPPLTDADIPF